MGILPGNLKKITLLSGKKNNAGMDFPRASDFISAEMALLKQPYFTRTRFPYSSLAWKFVNSSCGYAVNSFTGT